MEELWAIRPNFIEDVRINHNAGLAEPAPVNPRPMFLRTCQFHLMLLLLCLVSPALHGQYPHQDISARSTQQEALAFVDMLQGLGPSQYWPMVDPEKFVRNLRHNLANPERLYQGKRTNFCGYAALTYLFLKRDPLGYATSLVELYREGSTRCSRITLQPGADVRQEAGVMMNRRQLQEQHADQLWFLTLADQFKAYLNVWDPRFQPGKENAIWAAVTFQKFNRMVEGLLGIPTASDYKPLVRGHSANLLERLEAGLRQGEMVLYVDRNFKRSTWKEYLLPSHFVVLTGMRQVNSDSLGLSYWDYGAIKELTIRKKVLYSSLRGYTVIRKGPPLQEVYLQASASSSTGLDAVLRQWP